MADRPLPKFKYMLGYKKCLEIENGVIIRMYWEHPAGNEDFDHIEVIQRWNELHRREYLSGLAQVGCNELIPPRDFTTPLFLASVGFTLANVTRDGIRPLAAS